MSDDEYDDMDLPEDTPFYFANGNEYTSEVPSVEIIAETRRRLYEVIAADLAAHPERCNMFHHYHPVKGLVLVCVRKDPEHVALKHSEETPL